MIPMRVLAVVFGFALTSCGTTELLRHADDDANQRQTVQASIVTPSPGTKSCLREQTPAVGTGIIGVVFQKECQAPCGKPDTRVASAQVTISATAFPKRGMPVLLQSSNCGVFSAELPPGSYLVEASKVGTPECLERTVFVERGRATEVAVSCGP